MKCTTLAPDPRRLHPGGREAAAMKEAGGEERGGEALFEDRDFPSDDTSLFCDRSTPIAGLQGEITWRRPQVRPGAKRKCRRAFHPCVCFDVDRTCDRLIYS